MAITQCCTAQQRTGHSARSSTVTTIMTLMNAPQRSVPGWGKDATPGSTPTASWNRNTVSGWPKRKRNGPLTDRSRHSDKYGRRAVSCVESGRGRGRHRPSSGEIGHCDRGQKSTGDKGRFAGTAERHAFGNGRVEDGYVPLERRHHDRDGCAIRGDRAVPSMTVRRRAAVE